MPASSRGTRPVRILKGRPLRFRSSFFEDPGVPSTAPFRPRRTLIVADDLTGACDTAVAFAQQGAQTHVAFEAAFDTAFDEEWLEAGGESEVRALCTESRDVAVGQAIEQMRRVARELDLSRYDQVFKKVDSVFRGNTFHEIQAAVDGFADRFVVIAPAYPALGRIAVDGRLWVSDLTGRRSIAVREELKAVGLEPRWIGAGEDACSVERQMRASLADGVRTVFCDGVEDADLHAVVRAAIALRKRVLWIGSAGLAHALAAEMTAKRNLRPRWVGRDVPGIVLVFAGSDHPVSARQLEDLQQHHGRCGAESGWVTEDPAGGRDSEHRLGYPEKRRVAVFRVQWGVTTEEEIRAAVAGFSGRRIGCLFMTGGDTAMLVCRALRIRALRLQQEFAPGIPQGTAVGGPFSGSTIVLKSGGFGDVGAIRRVADHFSGCSEKSEENH